MTFSERRSLLFVVMQKWRHLWNLGRWRLFNVRRELSLPMGKTEFEFVVILNLW